MRKLHLLSAVILLGVVLATSTSWAQGTFKFKSNPHLPITQTQTITDYLYVPTNVKMTNVRIGLYAKVVYFDCLTIILTAPTGEQIKLTEAPPGPTNFTFQYGSWGSERSYTLFQDGGATDAVGANKQPNDRPIAPVGSTPFALLTGKLSQGWWSLRVEDHRSYYQSSPAQEGFLEAWTIVFNSVTTEPEVPIWQSLKQGSQLVGMLNGIEQRIPNEDGAGDICDGIGNADDPPVVPGQNGDAYPFIVSIPAYPGLLIGDQVPGYSSAGRFRITLGIATNYPNSPMLAAPNTDICVYFGKVQQFNPPLQNPPPPDSSRVTKEWPSGSGTTTPALLGPSPIFGGVRLVACNANNGWPPVLSFDVGGFVDATFDDLAINPIEAAIPCGDGSGSVCGAYQPEQQIASLNGEAVDGLYYVTVYDTYGDPTTNNWYGNIRVLSILVEYLAGGGETENPNMHEGIAGPLLGVPVPGAITGSSLGYLADVVGPIPPYAVHAKDQDPMMIFWATQKMGPRTAIGWERMKAVSSTGYEPPSGVVYDGPYAYPGSLDADPLVAGALVNADLIEIPVGTYRFRTNLMQARYDDDVTDNQFESTPIQVTDSRMTYVGTANTSYNAFQYGNLFVTGGYFPQFYVAPTGQSTSSNGCTFYLAKNPYSTLTSVDFRPTAGYVSWFNPSPRFASRVTVWKCSGGLTGAPVGPPVAMSQTFLASELMPNNWRSYPIYACDANGGITTNPTVNLPEGVYAVQIENMDANAGLLYPYTYGALPFMKDRYIDFHFSERFGPIAPYSQLGTRLQYTGTSGSAPTGVMSSGANPSCFSSFSWPLQINVTSLNDFSIDFLSINGIAGTESVSLSNAPFQPNLVVTSNSTQGGVTKTLNVRLEIFDGPTRVYLSDKLVTINGYQTVSAVMDQWNPTSGGNYHIKATFSRNPDDQNPVNDVFEYDLYVSPTRAILAVGDGVGTTEVNSAETALRTMGIEFQTVGAGDLTPVSAGSGLYVVGTLDARAQDVVRASVANGVDVAFVQHKDAKFGAFLQRMDRLFEVDRGSVDYDKVDLIPDLNKARVAEPKEIQVPDIKATSKEELIAALKAQPHQVVEAEYDMPVTPLDPKDFEHMLPLERTSPYGNLSTFTTSVGNTGIVYIVPEFRKPVDIAIDNVIPAGFVLNQNYPNPFNPTTSISYTLPEESAVVLKVTDLFGREIMTLASETQRAGTHTVAWKGQDQLGRDVASGQYLYRIDATPVNGGSTFTSVKKMMLAK